MPSPRPLLLAPLSNPCGRLGCLRRGHGLSNGLPPANAPTHAGSAVMGEAFHCHAPVSPFVPLFPSLPPFPHAPFEPLSCRYCHWFQPLEGETEESGGMQAAGEVKTMSEKDMFGLVAYLQLFSAVLQQGKAEEVASWVRQLEDKVSQPSRRRHLAGRGSLPVDDCPSGLIHRCPCAPSTRSSSSCCATGFRTSSRLPSWMRSARLPPRQMQQRSCGNASRPRQSSMSGPVEFPRPASLLALCSAYA